ncbi:MAG TPA: cupredoxin domain-containing protein [Gemmatimonadaceae bacterium]
MNALQLVVIAGGLVAIAWVNWYFFVAGRSPVAAAAPAPALGAGAEVRITVRGGYDPSVVRVRAGTPVRLVFNRQETSGCSEEVVFPDFGIRRYLPANKETTIELTPPKPGRYEFTCGMSMLRGALIAEAAP